MHTRGCSGKRETRVAVHRLQCEAIPHGMGAPTCAGLSVAPAACADWHGTACIPKSTAKRQRRATADTGGCAASLSSHTLGVAVVAIQTSRATFASPQTFRFITQIKPTNYLIH